MRRPLALVSMAMSSIFWQFVMLPGAQIVTEVYSVLTLGVGPGPASTDAVATLLAALAMMLPPVVVVAAGLWECDPLQEASAIAAVPIRIAVPNLMANT